MPGGSMMQVAMTLTLKLKRKPELRKMNGEWKGIESLEEK
jgi:hypothetical protein